MNYEIPKLKWTQGGMVADDKGGYVLLVDYENAERERDAAKEGWAKEIQSAHNAHIHAEKLYNKAMAERDEARAKAEHYRNREDGKFGYCHPSNWLPWEIAQMIEEDQ